MSLVYYFFATQCI